MYYGRTPPVPSFWRAWISSLLFIIPMSLIARAMFHWSAWTVLALGTFASVALAAIVSDRMRDDWRATCEMNFELDRIRRP